MKKYLNFVIIILATALVLYFSLKDHYQIVIDTIVNIDKRFLLIGIFLVIGYNFFKSIVMWTIAKNIKKTYRFREAFRMVFETNFFHAITPFSTGGQPYQVYSLKKSDIKLTDGTNISIQEFITYQIALVLLGMIAIISNYFLNLFPDNKILSGLVTIGFLANLLVIIALFVLTFTRKISKTLINFIIKLLSIFRIVKNKDETMEKFEKYLEEFHTGAQHLLKNKKQFFICIFLQFISLVCLYLVPFALIYGAKITYINPLVVIATSAYVMLIGAFVPIPGGTGGLEYSFIAFFSNFIPSGSVNAIMLLWRFITYYFVMIIGAIILGIGRKDRK